MLDHRVFLRFHHLFRETRSFHVTRDDADRRKAVRSPGLKGLLNPMEDRPESSTRAFSHHVSMSNQTICTVLNENHLRIFEFQGVQALNSLDCILRLSESGTPMQPDYIAHALNSYCKHCTCQRDFNKHLILPFVSYFLCFSA
ncbi:hypothetical protein TNCV_1681231 [Trichonephila clavipes]|nr:hypothetical protein TNCV_1681231 [Trichonephila clavipes]